MYICIYVYLRFLIPLINKNSRVYSPCRVNSPLWVRLWCWVGVVVSAEGGMNSKKDRKRNALPNGIGTGLPEGSHVAGE